MWAGPFHEHVLFTLPSIFPFFYILIKFSNWLIWLFSKLIIYFLMCVSFFPLRNFPSYNFPYSLLQFSFSLSFSSSSITGELAIFLLIFFIFYFLFFFLCFECWFSFQDYVRCNRLRFSVDFYLLIYRICFFPWFMYVHFVFFLFVFRVYLCFRWLLGVNFSRFCRFLLISSNNGEVFQKGSWGGVASNCHFKKERIVEKLNC